MSLNELPAVTAAEMRQIDDLATGEFHVSLLQMMENAGHSLARLARTRFLDGDVGGKRILVLAGVGGNGGGGMAAARRLNGWGGQVSVVLAGSESKLSAAAENQRNALVAAGVPVLPADSEHAVADLVIDAMLGYSGRGAPRPPIDRHVRSANSAGTPILSLDLPTGLDAENGIAQAPTVRANATLTLALPKTVLMQPAAAEFVGQLWLADLGLAPQLFNRLGLQLPRDLFASDDLLLLRD